MKQTQAVSRRRFVGGLAATLGYVGTRPSADLWAQGGPAAVAAQRARGPMSEADYDRMVKLGNNENNWGAPPSVMTAMNHAWKYAGRYGYPDANIVQVIAEHDGVKPENILLGAGSGEILDVVGTTFLLGNKKVVGVDPSYGSVYQHATEIKADAIKLPLTARLPPGHGRAHRGRPIATPWTSGSSTSATPTTRPASS